MPELGTGRRGYSENGGISQPARHRLVALGNSATVGGKRS
jgi:hypothetical protein